mmetsp:Transcript_10313/g.27505  ORF Transcript_10313/g.27505 Transcript_10313/m.27505 type:complete len:262 (-) Transcript_10313:63-848(-)
MAAHETQVLVRVKRPRDAEPVPELVVEAPTGRSKRSRGDASAAALRLVDSVPYGSDDDGLPLSLLRAASQAQWPLPPLPQRPAPDWRPLPAAQASLFQESRRRVVEGCRAGELVQLIDVELETEPKSLLSQGGWGEEAAEAEHAPPFPPAAPTVFTIGGMAMVATPTPAAPARSPHGGSGGDYVWDIYALSERAPEHAAAEMPGCGGLVRLAAPFFDEGEDWSDFDDIDDSQSDGGLVGSGSDSEHSLQDRSERAWADVLD